MKNNKLVILFALSVALSACGGGKASSDQVQRQQQEAMSKQGNALVGMPAIVNFQEKRILKDIAEKRDTAIVTFAYTQDMNGVLHKLCDSVGYGISAATQFTNPSRVWMSNGGSHSQVLPQADPNGLFSPASAEGTWVMCKNPNGGEVAAVYVEPRLIVSPFPLK